MAQETMRGEGGRSSFPDRHVSAAVVGRLSESTLPKAHLE